MARREHKTDKNGHHAAGNETLIDSALRDARDTISEATRTGLTRTLSANPLTTVAVAAGLGWLVGLTMAAERRA